MQTRILSIIEVKGVTALLEENIKLEQKAEEYKGVLSSLYIERFKLKEQLAKIDREILDKFSNIADCNAIIEGNQDAIKKISRNGINIDVHA